MRIGIFGGTFDPVHAEHYHLAKEAIRSLSLDKLIVVPARVPPHKRDKRLTADAERLQICRIAFRDLEATEVSDYEMKNDRVSYTFSTCEHFKAIYPNAELFWLVGTDSLRDFPTWKNPERILEAATLAVCSRAESDSWLAKEREKFVKRFSKDFAVVDYTGKDVSSTQVRVLAAAGEDIVPFVGREVARYIEEKGLYKIEGAKEALALLTEERKAHSLRVAFIAARRAPSLGVPEQKAITAALFHDCAKYLKLDDPLLKGFESVERVPAPVLHQFTGEYLARTRFGVRDEDVLNAIRYHTSGRANMSALERLIFLSDMLEDGRDFDGVNELREKFWDKSDDLTACIASALTRNLEYLREKGGEVYGLTAEAEGYYRKINSKE